MDNRLKHLNEYEVAELIERYYNNEKTTNLIKEYNLKIAPGTLYTIFPPEIFKDIICPVCNLPMIRERGARSSYRFNSNNIYCEKCGHVEGKRCSCEYCSEIARIEKKLKEQEQERINYKKRCLISEVYDLNKKEKINLENLSFRSKVYLGALLRAGIEEDMKEINPILSMDNKVSPRIMYTTQMINNLIGSNAIVVSPKSDLTAFPESDDEEVTFPYTYYTFKVKYALNIEFDGDYIEEVAKIMNPEELSQEDSEEATKIWREVALEECLEYFEFQMQDVKFDAKVGDKTIAIFKELLENFSVSQIYGIIYRSVANATKYYQQGGVSKKQAANSVIGNCQRYAEKALLEKWDLRKFGRPYAVPQSILSEFLFNRVLELGELGYNIPPTEI